MIYRTTPQEVENYRRNPAINQSYLKLINRSVFMFNKALQENSQLEEEEYEEKEYFLIGSAVDDYISQGEQYFSDNYYIADTEKPSSEILKIINKVFSIVSGAFEVPIDTNLRIYKELLIKIAIEQQYCPSYSREVVYGRLSTEICLKYWKTLVESNNKTVLSSSQAQLVSKMTSNLLNHHHTSKYFEGAEGKDKDIYYQLPIYFTYSGVDCKGLLDMVIVDHTNKTIQPIDIKTTGVYSSAFPRVCKKHRYDFQAAFYQHGLLVSDSSPLKSYLEIGFSNGSIGPYKLLPFIFMVESSKAPGTPLIFTCTDQFINTGWMGQTPSWAVEPYLGVVQAIERYKWHLENGFSNEREIVERDGNLPLYF